VGLAPFSGAPPTEGLGVGVAAARSASASPTAAASTRDSATAAALSSRFFSFFRRRLCCFCRLDLPGPRSPPRPEGLGGCAGPSLPVSPREGGDRVAFARLSAAAPGAPPRSRRTPIRCRRCLSSLQRLQRGGMTAGSPRPRRSSTTFRSWAVNAKMCRQHTQVPVAGTVQHTQVPFAGTVLDAAHSRLRFCTSRSWSRLIRRLAAAPRPPLPGFAECWPLLPARAVILRDALFGLGGVRRHPTLQRCGEALEVQDRILRGGL